MGGSPSNRRQQYEFGAEQSYNGRADAGNRIDFDGFDDADSTNHRRASRSSTRGSRHSVAVEDNQGTYSVGIEPLGVSSKRVESRGNKVQREKSDANQSRGSRTKPAKATSLGGAGQGVGGGVVIPQSSVGGGGMNAVRQLRANKPAGRGVGSKKYATTDDLTLFPVLELCTMTRTDI